jgi:protein-serine/threonine kinase
MLPPSPSAISPAHRQFVAAPSNLGLGIGPGDSTTSLGTFSTNGHLETPLSRSFDETPNGTRSFNQSPPLTGALTGPSVRPLDYSLLGSADAVHSELSQTVADLAQWLEVINVGLADILSPRNTFETTDDVVDSYSTESPIYPFEG